MTTTRDPRVDPRAGDVLNLIGWTVRVAVADDIGAAYFMDAPPHVRDSRLREVTLDVWRGRMAEAEVVTIATPTPPANGEREGRG